MMLFSAGGCEGYLRLEVHSLASLAGCINILFMGILKMFNLQSRIFGECV